MSNEQQPQHHTTKVGKYLMYSSFVMGIFYSFCGLFILFTDKFGKVDVLYRAIFCGMLLFYGGFRFYRAYKTFKQQQNEK